jgi:hypothetical protein
MTSLIILLLVIAVVVIALRSFEWPSEWSLIETIFFGGMLAMAALSCCP